MTHATTSGSEQDNGGNALEDTSCAVPPFICVHCCCPAPDLFQRVGRHQGEFRLRRCSQCRAVVDHYIEFEILLVLIDLQLFREEVYRHVLHNRFAERPHALRYEAVRFLLVCLMLDTYCRWFALTREKT